MVKRFSFNRSKANETSSPAAPPPAPKPDVPVAKVQTNGSSDIAAPTFLKPTVTSTPISGSGSSLVRRISAEYNSKMVSEDKTAAFASRAKPWLPNSPSTNLDQDKTLSESKVVKSASENSFKSSTFVASLLAPDSPEKSATSSSEQSFKLGSVEKSEATRRFPESAPPREESSSMKSLFASLEPSECKRVEEEFERLTNETAVDVQDPDAKLEEILSEEVANGQNKKVSRLILMSYLRRLSSQHLKQFDLIDGTFVRFPSGSCSF